MILQGLSVCLAAVLFQCAVQVSANAQRLNTRNVDQQAEIVNLHNHLRRNVQPTASNMVKMVWNPEIAANAQRWANECNLKHSSQDFRTINGKECGENLFMSSNARSWSDGIQSWYDEYRYFKYGVGLTKAGEQVGHYTQVVWYNSNEIGCGHAECPNQSVYKNFYVCQYFRVGNIVSRKAEPYKAGPPCGDCPGACDNGLCTNPCPYSNDYSNCADLKSQAGCEHPMVKKKCGGVCKCTTEIQ